MTSWKILKTYRVHNKFPYIRIYSNTLYCVLYHNYGTFLCYIVLTQINDKDNVHKSSDDWLHVDTST